MHSRALAICIVMLASFAVAREGESMLGDNQVEVVSGREYEGTYQANQTGATFDYLDGREGRLIGIFYDQNNRDAINSLDIFLMDPRYQDGKMVLIEIKDIIDIGAGSEWVNQSHPVTLTTIWREREQDTGQVQGVSTQIRFTGLQSGDYADVTVSIKMRGDNFDFEASLTYYDQLLPTLGYSLFVSAMVGLQILAGYKLVQIMDAPNFVFSSKISLLTLSLCNIQDFSQTMSHIQYIMGSQSGYLFFILPSLSYIVLFIIFDMKILFLVWRSHNLRNIENPQLLRKKLTAFYIQFYLGLFLYLTLTYFFSNDQWMIILSNLILVPQIVHNIRIGTNPGFSAFYIFGFIGTRLLLPVYERACPENRFSLTPNTALVVVLLSLYAIEVLLLYLQYRLGSRFFVPKRFQPNYFNYKKKLRLTEETKEMECSICLMNLFELAPTGTNINESLDESLHVPMKQEITAMSTPCNHNFHEQCLQQWMEVKLECPTCRSFNLFAWIVSDSLKSILVSGFLIHKAVARQGQAEQGKGVRMKGYQCDSN